MNCHAQLVAAEKRCRTAQFGSRTALPIQQTGRPRKPKRNSAASSRAEELVEHPFLGKSGPKPVEGGAASHHLGNESHRP